ncbi:AraC family transcriptional regulator [Paenibacillus sp. GCM10012306]|uniref:AraC family transcriptional regulator n=1 Tax=Paenibacillus sp. GCM10012306 TaxID=3317342 RepID=UPI003611DD71
MPGELRTAYYDTELQVEAYWFQGVMHSFPNHFHDHYVFGYIENSPRRMLCNNIEYSIKPGDLLIFNPGDVHSCEEVDGRPLDYRSINIKPDRMMSMMKDITGHAFLPSFTLNVLSGSEFAPALKELHEMIFRGEPDFIKEELFFFFIVQLLQDYANSPEEHEQTGKKGPSEFEVVCEYMETHYASKITLSELSDLAGLSKYHFLRAFTRHKRISPYNYLETIRIGNAKKLLEQGIAPVEIAHMTGFSDQSHFTHFFKRLIGLTPRQYMRIFHQETAAETLLSGERQ